MGAVLFGFLRHQANVRHAAHGGRVEGTVDLAVFDGGLVDAGVAAVRDDRLGILQFTGGVPHLARVTDHGRHRGVDDDVARHVQVGDAFVGVDHGQGRANGVQGLDVGFDLGLLVGWQVLDAGVQVADAVVGVEAYFSQGGGVLGQHVVVELFDDDAEHDRVGNLHHGGFQVYRQQYAGGLGIGDLLGDEGFQGLAAHGGAVDDFGGLDGGFFFQDGGGAVFADQLDAQAVVSFDQCGFFAAVEVALGHVGNVRLGVSGPGAHLVWVLAGVVLDRQRRAAVGVAFAQHRVHGGTLDAVVAGTGFFFFRGGRLVGVVRDVEALALQFLDRGLELRYRGADVRQLDDVGFRGGSQLAQFRQVIAYLLLCAQLLREGGKDTAGQGDVASFDGDVSRSGEGFDDRQQRVGGEGGGFVGEGIDDLGTGGHAG
ncbi:hypothetical protein D3C76_424740 [compost metagenome]